MSITRSTMSEVTFPNLKMDQSKEKSKNSPKIDESKIIFVNKYNKNRNLLKSFQLKLPYNKEKLKDFYSNITVKTNINLKPILKHNLNKKSISVLNGEDLYRKKVRFLDEVYEEILEQENYFYQTNNLLETIETRKKLIMDDKNKDNNLGLIIENFNRIRKLEKNNENTEKIESENILENIMKENMNENFYRNISNKNLVEIIEVPSYRYYNIDRTNDKDCFKKTGNKEENNVKCKCCLVF